MTNGAHSERSTSIRIGARSVATRCTLKRSCRGYSEAKNTGLIFGGTTGLGASLPGDKGILLDSCHSRHLDAGIPLR